MSEYQDRVLIDYETRSEVDIRHGVYKYVEGWSFQPILLAYRVAGEDTETRCTEDVDEMRDLVAEWVGSGTTIVAHNAQFERIVTSWLLRDHPGHPGGRYLDPGLFDDTMARAALYGYPLSLKHLAKALGAEEKDEAGTRLINLFCKPVNAEMGEYNDRSTHPAKWDDFVRYCVQDVDTLADVDRLLPPLTDFEASLYAADQRVNDTGIRIDTASCSTLYSMYTDGCDRRLDRVRSITGVENPNSLVQLKDWLSRRLGEDVKELRKEDVSALLDRPTLPDDCREVLEARQYTALVAAKKYKAFLSTTCADGYARGCLRYHGTHTGRWTSKGCQVHNMVGRKMKGRHASTTLLVDTLVSGDATGETLGALVRPMFVGPFTVCDFSQIENRVLPWLVHDTEMVEMFRDPDFDPYVEEAARMGPEFTRQQGKVACLALQYGGGVKALEAFGGRAMVPEGANAEEYLQRTVRAWRNGHPLVTRLWSTLEDDFVRAQGRFVKDGPGTRGMTLPSGRVIWYRDVRRHWSDKFDRYEYTCAGSRPGQRQRVNRMLLANNLVQGTARDFLAMALVRLDGVVRVAFHVHDEIVAYGDSPDVGDALQSAMTTNPRWAPDIPLKADPYVCDRYHKE